MAKHYDIIGYAVTEQIRPGVWKEVITEHPYYMEVVRNNRSLNSSGGINDNITISNQFSILADPFAYENFHAIRFVQYLGTKWKVTSIDVQYPRLILSVGGEYNGE